MATTLNWNGTNYSIPAAGEFNWSSLSNFLIALGTYAQTTSYQFWNTRVISTATDTVGSSDTVCICTNTGARTITLPPGVNGRLVVIIDGAGNAATNNLTIDGDGSETICGAANYVIDDNYGGISLTYNSTAGGWFGVSQFTLDVLNNPMTAVGDLIRGGTVTGGVAAETRLALGAANTVLTSNGTIPAYSLLVNANIAASGTANIALNKLAATTASRAVVSDGSGYLTAATTTATEIGYVNGVTSAIQTQLNAKIGTTLTSGQILVGNASNVATAVAMSGNVTISNTGATTIAALAVTDGMLAGSISDSKLSTISTAGKVSGSAITSGTIAGSTAWNTSGNITSSGVYEATSSRSGTSGFIADLSNSNSSITSSERLLRLNFSGDSSPDDSAAYIMFRKGGAADIGSLVVFNSGAGIALNSAADLGFLTGGTERARLSGYNLLYGGTAFSIIANTSDGSDNANIALCGGGGTQTTRGASVQVFGNEFATLGGRVYYAAGNVSTALTTNPAHVWQTGSATTVGQVTGAGSWTLGVRNTASYPGQAIAGCTDASSATAGDVGEYLEAVSSSSVSLPGTDTYTDIGGSGTGITLTAGDWDITLLTYFLLNGATCTAVQAGIGTASGSGSTGLSFGTTAIAGLPPTASAPVSLTIASYRVTISSTTTYYGKVSATYSAGTPQYRGRISARRRR